MNDGTITFKVGGAPALTRSFLKRYALFAKENRCFVSLTKKTLNGEILVTSFSSLTKSSFVNFFTNFLEDRYRESIRINQSEKESCGAAGLN
jgi:hypothetical protein